MGLYKINKQKKVGATIECPVCHKKFLKKQYSQAFCCIRCKDKFHNRVDGDRHKYSDYNCNYNNNKYPLSYDGADDDQWGDCDLGIHE